ncbi:MAG: hypothetical protein QM516_13120 [Limnohabitans sp.]|nr:hypothetical protein [Limnohabitans sp.]
MQTNRRTASGALRALLTLSATTAILAATSHFATPTAHADFVYGLNASGSKGIYRINTATGGVTLVASTPSLTASGAGGNGLAFDAGSNAFYYIRRVGATNYFMKNQLTGSGSIETTLGALTGNQQILSGTFYNGSYWAIPNGASNTILRCIPIGSTFTHATLPTAFPFGASFGDIASTASGITYASSTGGSPLTSGFRRFDLNALGTAPTQLSIGTAGYQLAFGNTGLFGVQGTNIATINTTTGALLFTAAVTTPGVAFNDLASIPAPGVLPALAVAALLGRRRR